MDSVYQVEGLGQFHENAWSNKFHYDENGYTNITTYYDEIKTYPYSFQVTGIAPNYIVKQVIDDKVNENSWYYKPDSVYIKYGNYDTELFISNDTTFQYYYMGTDSAKIEQYIYVQDKNNPNSCSMTEYHYLLGNESSKTIYNSSSLELKVSGDTLEIKETEKDNMKIFFLVKSVFQGSTSIIKKIRPTNIQKFQYFDLLGRPISNKKNDPSHHFAPQKFAK